MNLVAYVEAHKRVFSRYCSLKIPTLHTPSHTFSTTAENSRGWGRRRRDPHRERLIEPMSGQKRRLGGALPLSTSRWSSTQVRVTELPRGLLISLLIKSQSIARLQPAAAAHGHFGRRAAAAGLTRRPLPRDARRRRTSINFGQQRWPVPAACYTSTHDTPRLHGQQQPALGRPPSWRVRGR